MDQCSGSIPSCSSSDGDYDGFVCCIITIILTMIITMIMLIMINIVLYVDYGGSDDDGDYDGFVLIVLVERSISRSLILQGLELPHRLASISFYVHHLSVQTVV